MCNNPNLIAEVKRAKCAAIPLMIFAIINLLNIFSLRDLIYYGGAAFLVPLLGLTGAIVGVIASSTVICCTPAAGVYDQGSKMALGGKYKCATIMCFVATLLWTGFTIGYLAFVIQLAGCGGECYDHTQEAGWQASNDPRQLATCEFSWCNGEWGGDHDCCARANTASPDNPDAWRGGAGCTAGNVYVSEANCATWEERGLGIQCAKRVCCSTASEPPAGFTTVEASTCPSDPNMLMHDEDDCWDDDWCKAVLPWAIGGMIWALITLVTAILASVFMNKATKAIKKIDPAVPTTAATQMAAAVARPAVATAVATATAGPAPPTAVVTAVATPA